MTEEAGESNLIDWTEVQHFLETPPVEEPAEDFGSCRHFKVLLSDQAHTVTCRACDKQLDPFWYLQLLAKEWRHRRYELTRYEELKKEVDRYHEEHRVKREAAARFTTRPEKKGAAMQTWDRAVTLLGCDPPGVYRIGRYWYALSSTDPSGPPSCGYASLDYLESLGRDGAKAELFPHEPDIPKGPKENE
jgi:hypothetical protein